MSILITLLIAVVIIGLVFWMLSALPIAQPWKSIATVVLVVIVIVWLLERFGHYL